MNSTTNDVRTLAIAQFEGLTSDGEDLLAQVAGVTYFFRSGLQVEGRIGAIFPLASSAFPQRPPLKSLVHHGFPLDLWNLIFPESRIVVTGLYSVTQDIDKNSGPARIRDASSR